MSLAEVSKILDDIAQPLDEEIVLPPDLMGALQEGRRVVMKVASRIPAKGFDIAFIREKTPKEEVENVVGMIERLNREIQTDVETLLNDIARYEMLSNATNIGEAVIISDLRRKLTNLVIKCNKIINEVRRLVVIFLIYNSFKLGETLYTPAFPPRQ
ncbi:MAG: hypothetical protein NZ992_00080 [Candidatus Korarchaeum sp.]|nr:hypothetical protein [Candidatus Korarchaeum sp.]